MIGSVSKVAESCEIGIGFIIVIVGSEVPALGRRVAVIHSSTISPNLVAAQGKRGAMALLVVVRHITLGHDRDGCRGSSRRTKMGGERYVA